MATAAAAGTLRRKANPGASQYQHAAAIAIMDELEPRLGRALFDPIFAAGGVTSYDNTATGYTAFPMGFVSTPNGQGSNQRDAYGAGWEGYVVTLLHQLEGHPIGGTFSAPVLAHVCGPHGRADCSAAVLGALAATYQALVTANGGSTNVAGWTQDSATVAAGVTMPVYDQISYLATGIVGQPNMDWQNRPTFQQVVEFPAHRPTTSATAGTSTSTSALALPAPAAAPPGTLAVTGADPALAEVARQLLLTAFAIRPIGGRSRPLQSARRRLGRGWRHPPSRDDHHQ
ncbi:MAG: hypothetical protein ACYDAQ_06450 [Mycobacteriales bacterium]